MSRLRAKGGNAASGVAELPRSTVNTAMPTMTGSTIVVGVGGDLQAAINSASYGDTITVANAGTYSGTYTLPYKSGAGWIIIQPADMSMVPAPGTRIGAITGLPKIESPNNGAVFTTSFNAHHYRLIGLEIVPTANSSGLVKFGLGTETLAQMPTDLIVDRCYVHGLTVGTFRRGVLLNCAYGAVVDSTISNIHDTSDAQTILGYNGPGPFAITNNALESSGEVIMFGGADPAIYGLAPSDITVRRCSFTTSASYGGQFKNLFELKSARRVLLEGCVFDYAPQGGQVGGCITFKSASAGGDPNQGTQDVTMRLCIVKNVRSGLNVESIPEAVGTPRLTTTTRITYENVLAYNIGLTTGDAGNGFFGSGNPADVRFSHCTIMARNSAVSIGGSLVRLNIRNCVFGDSTYPIKGDSVTQGQPTLDAYAPGAVFTTNVMVLANQSAIPNFPINNAYPANDALVQFAADYSLLPGSPYKNTASDGTDPGADVAAVLAATAGV